MPQLVFMKQFKASTLQKLSARSRLLICCNPETGKITVAGKFFRLKAVHHYLRDKLLNTDIRECTVAIPCAIFMPNGYSNPDVAARIASFLKKMIQASPIGQSLPLKLSKLW